VRRLRVVAVLAVSIAAGGWLVANLQPLHRAPAGLDRVVAAEAIAKAKFGSICNNQPITIRRGALPPGRLARASWQYMADGPDDPGTYFDCVITLAHGHFPWPRFCTVVAHEVGHLAGYRAPAGQEFVRPDGTLDRFHSRNERSLMYPRFVAVWPPCRGRGPA
jgi:hypothetical protein